MKIGNSTNFIKQQIINNQTQLRIDEIDDLEEISTVDILCNEIKFPLENRIRAIDGGEVVINVKYNPNTKYDFFYHKYCNCDGSFVFAFDLMEEIINLVALGRTVPISMMPEEFEFSPSKYTINFTIGNFVSLTKEVPSANIDKPWATCQFNILLPIKIDFIENK